MIDHAWVLEGSANDHMSLYDVDFGTWTKYGQNDQVPPYGIFTWKKFSSPPVPSDYELIQLKLEPIENCVTTQGPTGVPTDFPTISTPSPTTPSPTIVPTPSPSASPSVPPTNTPTANPTDVCFVMIVRTPEEPGGTSVFEDGTDGHPNTIAESPDGEEWYLFYWGHNLQKRDETVTVKISCVDSLPPTQIPTPQPSPLPSTPPTPLPSPKPSFMPSPAPSPMPSTVPSPSPTLSPTVITDKPTFVPTATPSSYPTFVPTA